MDRKDFDIIKSGDVNKCREVLKRFVEQHSHTFDFTAFNQSGQWQPLWNGIFQLLYRAYNSDAIAHIFPDCLAAIRILSREKQHLNHTIANEQFDCLLNIANIGNNNIVTTASVSAEALKALCNLVFQSTKCQELCLKNSTVEGIIKRLRTYREQNVHYDLQLFDMKLLFLVTALNPAVRTKLRDDYHGLTYLVETLDLIIKEPIDGPNPSIITTAITTTGTNLSIEKVNLINEILKVLFNVTVRNETSIATEEEEEIQFRRLAIVLHDLLLCTAVTTEKQYELHSNTVNLLTNTPTACYTELVISIPIHNAKVAGAAEEMITDEITENIFENHDITALNILLNFLKARLENVDKMSVQQELISPILTALLKCAQCNSLQRRYLRTQVLPPLIDVQNRPEVGNSLRNYLCRLLTTPATQVRDLVAEFLFIICKENVNRMIKYTGYGNAAGLFANRRLLGGATCGGGDHHQNNLSCEYSSDSEDSDTEEYKKVQENINPVLGCYEPPRPSPFEGMTDEQKEYEAMKLVHLMDQLNRQGIVQPCRIGADGRPEAVDHILELQVSIPQQQFDHKRKT